MVFTKKCVHKVRIFNNFLHFVEIKAVLEGRGFRPNFLGKAIFAKSGEITPP